MNRPGRFAVLAAVGLLACAPRSHPGGAPVPVETLEAERLQAEGRPDRLTLVGIKFYDAGAYQRAADVFAAALALDPDAFPAAVQLGLSLEAMGRFDDALAAYRRAQGMKTSRAERRRVEQHMVAVTRSRFAAEARAAVAAEQTLSELPPVPNSVAVLPWTYLGANPELRPLERGVAHLVVTDLAKVSRLTLLERERVQALADELQLALLGRVDSATAARSGRLLRAADVIQGSIRDADGGNIRLDANIVNASTARVRASGAASDRLNQLIAMEKNVVLDLLGRLGITLSPAEARAISERPTADLQAFLAFSRGLEAEDHGNFGEAERRFQEASARDPSFQIARDRARQSARARSAGKMTPALLARAARGPGGPGGIRGAQLAAALQGIAPSLAGRLGRGAAKAAIRSRLAEALRQDDPARLGAIGKIVVTIPRP